MKKILYTIFFAFICCLTYAQTSVIDRSLREEMAKRGDDEKIEVNIILKAQYDQMDMRRQSAYYVRKSEKRTFVVNELKRFSASTQEDLLHILSGMEDAGMVSSVGTMWVTNLIHCEATKAAIIDLAQHPDVMIIGYNMLRNYLPDDENPRPANNNREITQNVLQVNADDVWAEGYTGEGIIVAVIDTGVNYNHLDIKDHLWDGGPDYPNHGWNTFSNDNDPMDDMGHGSHCAGTICGDGTAGSQTGMAPDVTLMCIKVLDYEGNGSINSICNGVQFAIEHGADIFSMSLGFYGGGTEAERIQYRQTMINALEANIVGAVAAGNEGTSVGTLVNVRVPGNCPPPWIHPDQQSNPGGLSCVVSIGAVNYNDNAADFSSHGPVTWQSIEGYNDYPYVSGSQTEFGLIRPDVCAPGVNIKSLNYETTNGYTYMDGTSMATPCAAGVMALLLSKNPQLTPAEIDELLETTGRVLSPTKSNIFGSCRIDAFEAIKQVSISQVIYVSHVLNDAEGNNDGKLNPGENVSLSVNFSNTTESAIDISKIVLTSDNDNVNITDSIIENAHFEIGQTLTFENAFAFTGSSNLTSNYRIPFRIKIYDGNEMVGKGMFNILVYDHKLEYGTFAVLNDDNNNGLLEVGETADLRVFIDNNGNELAAGLTGVLTTNFSDITINGNTKSYGTIGSRLMGYADYNVTLSPNAAPDFIIPFLLEMTDVNGRVSNFEFSCRNACNAIFDLHDSYGDGWNGASITVNFSDGTPSQNITIEYGSNQTHVIEIGDGVNVSLGWNAGSYDSECSYIISYENGAQIYSGIGAQSGTFFTWENDCPNGGFVPELCNPAENLSVISTGNDVSLTWDAPIEGSPIGYEVYRATTLLATSTGLSYEDLGVEDGVYEYCVYALYDDCQSTFECQTVEISPCSGVENLHYSLNGTLLTLQWETPSDPTDLIEYQVFVNGEQVETTSQLSYEMEIEVGDNDLCVKAVYPECEKRTCLSVSVCPWAENLTYTTEGRDVTLHWTTPEAAQSFSIYADNQLIGYTNENSYTVSLPEGMTNICVEAIYQGCVTIPICTQVCICDPITDLAVNFIETNLGLSWNRPSNSTTVTGYNVYLNGSLKLTTEETNCTIANEVGENNICVESFSEQCQSEKVCQTLTICEPASQLSYTYQGNEVTLNWEGSASRYVVFVDDAWVLDAAETNCTIQMESGIHNVCVKSIYDDGCLVSQTCISVEINCSTPQNLEAQINPDFITILWSETATATGYNLYRDGELIAENISDNVYVDSEAALDATYCYTVAALCGNGLSETTQEVCAKYYFGVEDSGDDAVKVYPNPTNDKVKIECDGMIEIVLLSADGKRLRTIIVSQDEYVIDDLQKGLYVLQIKTADSIIIRKFMKL